MEFKNPQKLLINYRLYTRGGAELCTDCTWEGQTGWGEIQHSHLTAWTEESWLTTAADGGMFSTVWTPTGPSALFWFMSASSSSGGFQMYCSPFPMNITSCQRDTSEDLWVHKVHFTNNNSSPASGTKQADRDFPWKVELVTGHVPHAWISTCCVIYSSTSTPCTRVRPWTACLAELGSQRGAWPCWPPTRQLPVPRWAPLEESVSTLLTQGGNIADTQIFWCITSTLWTTAASPK